jgi:hypothetical protein
LFPARAEIKAPAAQIIKAPQAEIKKFSGWKSPRCETTQPIYRKTRVKKSIFKPLNLC